MRTPARRALAAAAVVGLVFGGWLASRSSHVHDEERRVTAVFLTSSNDRPYGISLDNGSNLYFHSYPGVGVGEPIGLRYDQLGRLLGTVRHGQYVAKAEQPPKVVFFIPLAAALILTAAIAWILLVPDWQLRRSMEGGWSLMGHVPGITSRRMKRYASRREAGLTTWLSRDELATERRRMTWATVVLGFFAALWLLMILTSPTGGILGTAIFLEVVTCVPLGLVGSRRHQLTKLLKRAASLDSAAQAADAEALQLVDESLMHLARLVAQLRPGPIRDSAEDSFASAERACMAWRRLLDREADIDGLVVLAGDHRARESLERSLTECRQQTRELRAQVEDLAAATAALVTASDDDVAEQVARVAAAGDRAQALASSLEDLNALPLIPKRQRE